MRGFWWFLGLYMASFLEAVRFCCSRGPGTRTLDLMSPCQVRRLRIPLAVAAFSFAVAGLGVFTFDRGS